MSARIHTQTSNRAQPKKKKRERPNEDDPQRKVVFKSVLDNPLIVKWPDVPLNVQNTLLAAVTRLLEASGIGAYHEEREKRSRQNRKKSKTKHTKSHTSPEDAPSSAATLEDRKRKTPDDIAEDRPGPFQKRRLNREAASVAHTTNPTTQPEPLDTEPPVDDAKNNFLAVPPIHSSLIFGINEVAKRLETQIQRYRQPSQSQSQTSSRLSPSPLRFIFACTQDIDPPSLIEHLPPLVAACNASRPRSQSSKHGGQDQDVLLIPLPKMAEGNITEAAGLRRVAVFALDVNTPNLQDLEQFASSIPVLWAPWLVPQIESNTLSRSATNPTPGQSLLIPTQIKQLRTTAPKDVKAVKEQRAKGRADAKARKAGKGATSA